MDPKNYDRLIEIYEALADYGYREVGQEYLQNVLNTDKSWMPMTAVVFIITWEIIRKPTWHWKKPRVRVEWTAICTWGKLMLPPEIIIMPPVCTAITCPSRDRMRRSIISWDYVSWRKGLPEGVGSISGRKTDRREQPDADLILQRDRGI